MVKSIGKNKKVQKTTKNAQKVTVREFFKLYMVGEIKLERWQRVGVAFMVVVISGVVGWVYEFLLAWVETGQIYMKGGNLLPWINIYAIGAVLLAPVVYRLRKYPWAVFVVAVLITGAVELTGGWLVYVVGNGTRYWNYAEGVWAIGSINGFVCLMSVTIFGLGALMLTYAVLPLSAWLARRMKRRMFLIMTSVIFAIFMLDEAVNLTLKNLDQPTAVEFYKSLGMKYQEF